MRIQYKPKGVCARMMELEMEDGVIKDLKIQGGCSGNLQGICKLVKGRDAKEVIQDLKGIHCGPRPTSCPDQLALALEQALAQN